ncbi:MAG TPA: hypothetical protein H9768_02560 [Candidatus Mailhella merdavium]|nr:hypothetical protein [Candidatus Mailhella merdavium]
MDPSYSSAIADLGASLTSMAAKGAATLVYTKIKASKNEKNIETIKNNYEEIINELLSEREEAVRIAQAYKSELEKVSISDKDIEYLHATISRLIELLTAIGKMDTETQISFTSIKELISIDTLKTMQLLGFNYKAAIGEPLTELCAQKIASLGNSSKKETLPRVKNQTR